MTRNTTPFHEVTALAILNGIPIAEDVSGVSFLSGNYRVSAIAPPRITMPVTSQFAKENLMYAQCVSMGGTVDSEHFTERSNCSSYLFALTLGGRGELSYRGKTYTLVPGSAFLISCREEHLYRSSRPHTWSYDLIHMYGGAMDALFGLFSEREQFVFSVGTDGIAFELLKKVFSSSKNSSLAAELKIHQLLTELWNTLLSSLSDFRSPALPPKIQQICGYIQTHYKEDISLDEIAKQNYISKSTLCREFKKSVGTTPGEYITRTRLLAAKQLLINTDLPIHVVASEVGFAYPNYFYSVFRKYEGITPQQCRIHKSVF